MEDERTICRNCGMWRELHYAAQGNWVGDKIGCVEYQGTVPSEERLAKRQEEVKRVRQQLKDRMLSPLLDRDE